MASTITNPDETKAAQPVQPAKLYGPMAEVKAVMPQADPHGAGAGKHGHGHGHAHGHDHH